MRFGVAICVFFLFFLCSLSCAYSQTGEQSVTAGSDYVMGENDTKKDAGNLSFLKSRKKSLALAAEKIADTAGQDHGLTREQVLALAPALVEVRWAGETIRVEGGDIVFHTEVASSWKPENVPEALKKLASDPELRKEIIQKEKDVTAVESRIRQLQKNLEATGQDKAVALRKERGVLFAWLNELGQVPQVRKKPTLKDLMKLRAGMSFSRMTETVGMPLAKAKCAKRTFFDYGPLWVIFSDGIVKGYIPEKDWQGPCHAYATYRGEIKYF